jgi:drug/metabolite transporter (DMT)-like permease
MDQYINKPKNPLAGAMFMIAAGITFAVINAITYKITASPDWGGLGFKPQSDTFWQYAIALVLSLPFLWRFGRASLKSAQMPLHIARVVVSALGLQAFTMAIAKGVPVWQVVALTMTAPFFVLIGARIFLGETVLASRWLASLVGFVGALIVTNPWSEAFSLAWLLPVVAAILWGGASLFTKHLSKSESPESLTVWLLLLLTPINAALSATAGFELPSGNILYFLLAGGVLVMLAQYFLSRSYAAADANFVQPFDDLKLISNVLVYGLIFSYWPSGWIWLGLAMIMAASGYLMWSEKAK